jgi:VanZ family protein
MSAVSPAALLEDINLPFIAATMTIAAVGALLSGRALAARYGGTRLTAAALVLYVGLVVALTCSPRADSDTGFAGFSDAVRHALRTDVLRSRVLTPLSGAEELVNVLLYVPLGFLLVWLTRRPLTALVALVAFSVVVEVWQGFVGRSLDVGDVLHNVWGAVLGMATGWVMHRFRSTQMSRNGAATETRA